MLRFYRMRSSESGAPECDQIERDVKRDDGNKKIGAESGDPNLHFQPRLPGSVVGEASMRQVENSDKITRVTVRSNWPGGKAGMSKRLAGLGFPRSLVAGHDPVTISL